MTRHDALKFLEADTDINEPNVLLKQCIKAIRDPKTKSFDQWRRYIVVLKRINLIKQYFSGRADYKYDCIGGETLISTV